MIFLLFNSRMAPGSFFKMFKFFIFSVIVVALVYQPVPTEASGKDEAKGAFHKLMEVVDKTLTQAQDALNEALNSVKAKSTELENKARAELDKALVPLQKKLDDLIAKAKAKGKCQSHVDHFAQTPDTLVHNMVDCVNQQINKAQNLVNDALNNVKKIQQDLNSIDAEIDECNANALKQAKCYAKIISQIAKDTKDAPQSIVEDVAKATALITIIIPILEQCEVTQFKKAAEDAAQDVVIFGACAAVK